MLDWLATWLQQIWDSFKEFLLWIIQSTWEGFLTALSATLSLIPVPDWINSLQGFLDNIPSSVIYWLEPFQISTGINIILGSYLIRFLIRRIPFIG